LFGRTRCNRMVFFPGNDRHQGQFLDVRITHARDYTLYGDPAILG